MINIYSTIPKTTTTIMNSITEQIINNNQSQNHDNNEINVHLIDIDIQKQIQTLNTIINIIDWMKQVMNQDNEVLKLYNDIQEATSILVHDGKWRNNYINKLIQFDNEKNNI